MRVYKYMLKYALTRNANAEHAHGDPSPWLLALAIAGKPSVRPSPRRPSYRLHAYICMRACAAAGKPFEALRNS